MPIITVGASGADHTTISAAIAAATAGDTILVSAGTYDEDVVIDKELILLSVDGAGSTIINGQNGALGAIEIDPNAGAVQIGDVDQGFTVLGNNGNGAVENAAIYLQGAQDGITIRGNVIEARGDAGLISEFSAAVTNVVVDQNSFTGQTFEDPEPGGNGFATQFDVGNNVPRQLVTLGGNDQNTSNVTFTNNIVSGTAGGTNAGGEQGNTLVTIDAENSMIADNEFTGFTNRFATALRAREDNTDITGNTFDASASGSPNTAAIFVVTPVPGVQELNTFIAVNGDITKQGSPGDDTLTGGTGDDEFTGGAGNDHIDGQGGTDAANYAGSRADFSIARNIDGTYTVTDNDAVTDGDEGTDTLTGVENVFFAADGITFELDVNSPDTSGYTGKFEQGFETDNSGFFLGPDDWSGSLTLQPSGTNGITAPEGGSFALAEQTSEAGGLTGPFTRFDGYRADFAGGFSAQVKVYLDPTWADGEGFDWAVAAGNQSGGHLRDFIFHVTKDADTGTIIVGADNNTNFDPQNNLETKNHVSIDTAGWYTLEHNFYENEDGNLEVAMNVYDDSGAWLFTEIRSNESDDIATTVGGNRYGWFTNIDVASGIAIDAVELNTATDNLVQLRNGNLIKAEFATPEDAALAAAAGDVIIDAAGDFRVFDGMSIQAAVDAASDGDKIIVGEGVFTENVVIDKEVTLEGAQAGLEATGAARTGGESVINGTGTFGITVLADNVTIDGFEITDFGRDAINVRTLEDDKPGDPAVGAFRSDVTIANNWLHSDDATGQRNGVVVGEGTILNFVLWRGNCSERRPTYEHRQRPVGPADGRPFARRPVWQGRHSF